MHGRQPTAPGEGVFAWMAASSARVSSRSMCEHFIARAAEPFRLDELWPFTERSSGSGWPGYGWGAAWLGGDGGLGVYRDIRAFRDDPGRETVGATETTSALVHLRRPSRLSTLTLPDTQPFDDPAGRFAFSHNGDLRDYKDLRATYRAAGRIHGRADTEVGERWLEDEWQPDASAGSLLAALHERFGGQANLARPGRRRDAAPLRGQRREPRLRLPPRPDRDRVDRDLLARPLALPVRGASSHRPHAGSLAYRVSHSGRDGRHSVVQLSATDRGGQRARPERDRGVQRRRATDCGPELRELFDLNSYWLAVNILWGALGISLLPIS